MGDGDDWPAPLATACAAKGKIAAFLAGPIDCDKRGWFCRIERQDGFVPSDGFRDSNFAHCNRWRPRRSDGGRTLSRLDSDDVGWCRARPLASRGYTGSLDVLLRLERAEGLDEPVALPAASVGGGGSPDVPGRPTRTTVRRSRVGARRTPSSRSTIPRRAPTVSAGASTRSPTPGRRGSRRPSRRERLPEATDSGWASATSSLWARPRVAGLRGHLRRLGDYRRVRVDAHRECSRVFKSVHVY